MGRTGTQGEVARVADADVVVAGWDMSDKETAVAVGFGGVELRLGFAGCGGWRKRHEYGASEAGWLLGVGEIDVARDGTCVRLGEAWSDEQQEHGEDTHGVLRRAVAIIAALRGQIGRGGWICAVLRVDAVQALGYLYNRWLEFCEFLMWN